MTCQPSGLVRAAIAWRLWEHVNDELERARAGHPALHSAHEAYAVLAEELDEFKAIVWRMANSTQPTILEAQQMRHELIQLAAMCARTVLDLGLYAGGRADAP